MQLVRELALRDFRNYASARLVLDRPGLHIVWGGNGQGKTSLLEALFYAAFLRSFRTACSSELVRFGAESFDIAVTMGGGDSESGDTRVSVRGGRQTLLRKNGVAYRRASEFINSYLCVALIPEDIRLVCGGPSRRRQFCDMVLAQTDGTYLSNLMAYRRALRSRNALFSATGTPDAAAARAFGQLMGRHGAVIIQAREALCERLNTVLNGVLAPFVGSGPQPVSVHYRPSVAASGASRGTVAAELTERIERGWERDRRERCTTSGPHRDDVEVRFGDKPAAKFASQGEQRISGLLLKLASFHLATECARDGRAVLLLVDDVLGDLDQQRRQTLANGFAKAAQVVMVQTEKPNDAEWGAEAAGVTHVENGVLNP
jgi:DNA replication and repair protein RecF